MKLSTSLKYGLGLLIIFGIALFVRIYFPYHNVFRDGWVNFQETDCYYNMRQLEILARYFPHRMLFDPYFIYPGGSSIGSPPFFYLFLGFFAWVFGAGSPTEKLIETVGAYLPAILGALVTVPVYFIGKELFSRKAGLIAAALIAILPGQFLWRTMLGFPDYHVAETLFGALTMMFLVMAVKSSEQRQISFESLKKRDWPTLRRPLLYALLAGIALGLYLLTWVGAGLFIFIIFIFAIIQYVMDHLRGRSTNHIFIVGVVSFIITLIMMALSWNGYANWNLGFASLLIGLLVFLALGVLSFLMASRNIKKAWYPVAVVGLGGIGLGLFYLIDPSLFRSILDRLEIFTPSAGMLTVAEVKSLWPWANPDWYATLWSQFTTCFYLALISLVIIAYLVVKEGNAGKTLLLVWSVVMLVATFGQNRFAYYSAVNVALLTAYPCWKILEFASLRKSSEVMGEEENIKDRKREKQREKTKQGKKSKRKRRKPEKRQQGVLVTRYLSARNIYSVIAIVVIFFLVFYPNTFFPNPTGTDIDRVSSLGATFDRLSANTGLSDDWHEALVWMSTGNNTEDPFEDLNNPDFYYELHQRPSEGEAYQYPDSAYGVMSWWDYGYAITYVAHRIPNANPSQIGAPEAGQFFTALDESSANEMLDKLGSKYVIIDYDMAAGKYYAMIEWAEKDQREYSEWYFQETSSGELQPIRLYHPAYYQSMCSRLYNFGGEAVTPSNSTYVISYAERVIDKAGFYDKLGWLGKSNVAFFKDYFDNIFQKTGDSTYKLITGAANTGNPFATYDDAQAYLELHGTLTNRIVGLDAFSSPVPLEKLGHYELKHKSPTTVTKGENGTISYVEIFKYSP